MIRFNKPRGDTISYVSLMCEKALHRLCKENNILRRRFALLLLCNEYIRYSNRLVTAYAVHRFAPYQPKSLTANMEYLKNRDYLVSVKGKRAKLDADYHYARRYYDISEKGKDLIHQYNTLVGREMAKWRNEIPKWKLPSQANQKYYQELGIMK